MSDKLLKDLPGDKIESACNFNNRDRTNDPYVYLESFLKISRQYGYATRDDSWGELEKELEIVFRRLEKYKRYIDSSIHHLMISGDNRDYSEILDDLLERGEKFWEDMQIMKKHVKIFG